MGAKTWLQKNLPKGIILSGSYDSVNNKDALSPSEEILELGVPILGIYYGMQWLTRKFSGWVTPKREFKEYGPAMINYDPNNKGDAFFSGMKDWHQTNSQGQLRKGG